MARRISVEIVGDASSLERAFKKSSRSADKWGRDMNRATRGGVAASGMFAGMGRSIAFASGGFLGGAGFTAAVKSSVTAASDLEQQISKTNVVFSQSSHEVEDWSRTLADSFGLSQREALTTASTFGALLAPIGLVGEQSAKQSMKLTQLGADLASFYNTDVQSALDAIRSGLVGEAEPLRKYGVLLSEVRVQQEALRQTGKQHAADLTVQEKALARIKIIFQDSKVAQGDFGRTADTAANQIKIFQANLENLKIELGSGLVPALAGGVSALNDFFGAMKSGEDSWNKPLLQHIQDLRARVMGDRARRHPLPFTKGFDNRRDFLPFQGVQQALEEALRMPPGAGGAGKKTGGLTKAQLAERRSRIRQANEAFRQQLRDRAAFNVEKTGATKTLKDDLVALRRYNALLTKQIKGGHGTLELEREQFHVQMQIADVLKQQADALKKQKQHKKRMGVDVTRFQKTARGQFVLAGAAGGGRGVMIQGGVHLHGIQNVSQLENELARRSKQRARQRRAR